MSITRRALGAAGAAVVLALSVGSAPAQADNPVLTDNWASAKYVDLTDKLCAKVGANFGSSFWSEAVILDGQRIVKSKQKIGNNNGAWACTANLSIPEDQRYTLLLRSCTEHSYPRCTETRKAFYS